MSPADQDSNETNTYWTVWVKTYLRWGKYLQFSHAHGQLSQTESDQWPELSANQLATQGFKQVYLYHQLSNFSEHISFA